MTTTSVTEQRRLSNSMRWIILCVCNAVLVSLMLVYVAPAISPTPLGRYFGIFIWPFIFLIPTNIMQWLLVVSVLRINRKWLRLIPWVILSIIGSYVGSLLYHPASDIFSGKEWEPALPVIRVLLTFVGGMFYGVGIGIGQWICLADRRANFWWVIVNTIGFTVAYCLLLLR